MTDFKNDITALSPSGTPPRGKSDVDNIGVCVSGEGGLNPEFDLAWNIIANTDTHLFLTGKAGTGKTTFLRELRRKVPKRMIVVAPTGIAAINAEGVTIHSFFQLPFGPQIEAEAHPYR